MGEYVWQQSSWVAKLCWDDAELIKPLGNARLAQGRLLGKADNLGLDLGLELMEAALVEEAMKTSAIEGERLDRDSVRSSVARRLGIDHAGLPRPRRNVDGLVEMLVDATTDIDRPLTTDRLKGWHAALFPTGYSGIRQITVGNWRPGPEPMRVVSGGLAGSEHIHFEAVRWEQVPDEMQSFLTWFQSPPSVDGLIHAGVAHIRLLTIHPFDDGNGRVTRAVTDLALARDEGSSTRLWSLSAQIEAERSDYYAELERAQRGDGDLTLWLCWFIGCCARALGRAEAELDRIAAKVHFWTDKGPHSLNPRQLKAMNRMLDAGPGGFEGGMTTRKYARLTRTSPATAQRDIAELVRLTLLIQRPGGGRSSSYEVNWRR